MQPADLFDAVRGAYFDAFVRAVQAQTNGYAEVLIQPCLNGADTAVPRTPRARPFRMPMRQDLVPVKDGAPQAIVVVRGPEADFLPLAWEFDEGFQLQLEPFSWDEVHVVAFGLPADVDFSSLVRWFEEWADLKEEEDPDEETGLRLLAHHVKHLSGPRGADGATGFELDMGTAPAAALTDFVDLLSQLGATKVMIGQVDQDEGAAAQEQV